MEQLKVLLRKIKPDVNFESNVHLVDSGILDSIDIVEIITSIEEEFGIEISPDQVDPDNFETVEAMWEMIQRQLS